MQQQNRLETNVHRKTAAKKCELVFTLQQQPLRLPKRRHRLVAVPVIVAAAGARFLLQASVPANGGRIGVVVVEAVSSTNALVVAVAEKGISI